jgi:hypothetical protein
MPRLYMGRTTNIIGRLIVWNVVILLEVQNENSLSDACDG